MTAVEGEPLRAATIRTTVQLCYALREDRFVKEENKPKNKTSVAEQHLTLFFFCTTSGGRY